MDELASLADANQFALGCRYALLVSLRHRQIADEKHFVARGHCVVEIQGHKLEFGGSLSENRTTLALQKANGPSTVLAVAAGASAAEAALYRNETLRLYDQQTSSEGVKDRVLHENHRVSNLTVFLRKAELCDERVAGGCVRGVDKGLELVLELSERHSHGEAVPPNVDGGHHPAVSQLRVDEIAVEVCWGQGMVGFDAANEVQFSGADVGDEVNKLHAEFLGK